ncbi:RDD family protein [Bacillus sp. FJAT-45037]|uniref:RDD family protein n=1 Tax=Bacillus sp. FJAT-45037 TaxID=2011007 RepID=UPI000C24A9F4|nr:RDD family protein [Bacillus sp. FJAT-45037]
MGIDWKERLLNKDELASGWYRLLAAFYDFLFLGLVMVIASAATTSWLMVRSESPHTDVEGFTRYLYAHEFHLLVINWLVLAAVFVMTHILYVIRARRSFGMMIVDLHVYNEEAEKPSAWRLLGRETLKYLLFPFVLVTFFKKERPLYEKITKTYLVK